ncbi:hypothetical protein AB3480_06425 [Rhizobium mongolense]|uniref:hypothetical protein n=1 Tax=Rhizobium mongolense TaxID=57676 RepID=UPI0034A2D573
MTAEEKETGALTPVAPAARTDIYIKIVEQEFRQGEIISGLTQYIFDAETNEISAIQHPYVIVASQDCDLFQDYGRLESGQDSDLNCILCYEAHLATDVRGRVAGSDIWKRVSQNNDDRYHALQSAAAEYDNLAVGIPDMVIDFKKFFAITNLDLSSQIKKGEANRRTRLKEPYREHFQSRAAFYLQRVALPEPHRLSPIARAK